MSSAVASSCPPPHSFSSPSCNTPRLIMTGKEEIDEPSGPSTLQAIPAEPAAPELDPKKAYQIAPDGDIILYTPGEKPSSSGPPQPVQNVSFLVSSAHLKLSSKYFNTLLSDRWSDAQDPPAGGLIAIEVIDCKHHTLQMILDIIHGHTRKVPRQITLDQLAEFSIMVDFFQCVEVVELVAQMWIETLKPQVPAQWSDMIPTWIMISSVFNNEEILSQVSKIAVEEGKGALSTNGLPIPSFLKESIDQSREAYLQKVLCAVESHIGKLLLTKICGRGACNAAYLGALLIKLTNLNIHWLPTAALKFPTNTSTTIPLEGLSPSMVRSLLTAGKLDLQPTCDSSCLNNKHPWGQDTRDLATQKCDEVQIPKI